MKCSNNVLCVHLLQYFWCTHKILEHCPIMLAMLNAFTNLLCLKLCWHNWHKPNLKTIKNCFADIEI